MELTDRLENLYHTINKKDKAALENLLWNTNFLGYQQMSEFEKIMTISIISDKKDRTMK